MPSPEKKQQLSARIPSLPGKLGPYSLLMRPLFFRMDPEFVHDLVVGAGEFLSALPLGRKFAQVAYARRVPHKPVRLAGLEFRNPLGIAAGFDKNAAIVPLFESLGFGFVEIGTVTPRPQLGNPRPRLLRVPSRRAIVNRMGSNNDGQEAVALNVAQAREQVKIPIGVNLGKNRDTPNSEAVRDYEIQFKTFRDLASYFAINISSPNTPGLRELQSGRFLQALGDRVVHLRHALGLSQPVFVKLAPDLERSELEAACSLCGAGKPYAGLILTNTIPTDLGGMSGFPLKGPSVAMLKLARQILPVDVPVMSVGGIETGEDVIERFTLGANAVQFYTSLIYRGPGVAARMMHEVDAIMRKRGIRDLSELRQR